MARNSKFLKNLLTTASAIALLAGGITSASAAAVVRTITGDVNLTSGAGLNQLGAPPANAAFVNASVLQYTGQFVARTGANPLNIQAIDINRQNLGDRNHFEFEAATTLGAVGNGNGIANQGLYGVLGAGVDVILSGTTAGNITGYAGLTGFDFFDNDSSLIIAANNIDLSNLTVLSTGRDNGTISIAANVTGVRLGHFTAHGSAVNSLNLGAGSAATSTQDIFLADDLNIGNGAALTLAARNALSVGRALAIADNGSLALSAQSPALFEAGALLGVNAHIDIAGGVDAPHAATITGGDISGTANGQGILNFNGGFSSVAQTIGNNHSLLAVNVNAGVVALMNDATATTFNLVGAGATFTNTGHEILLTGNVTDTGSNGVLKVDGSAFFVQGNLGTNLHALGTINFDSNDSFRFVQALDNTNGYFVNNVTNTSGAVAGRLYLTGNGMIINGQIGAAGNASLAEVNLIGGLDGAGTFQLAVNTNIFTRELDLAREHESSNILQLMGNNTITGNIISTQQDFGILDVKGNATITGDIGTLAAPIDAINFTVAGAAANTPVTLTIGAANINTTHEINFAGFANTQLVLNNTTAPIVTINSIITATGLTNGSIIYNPGVAGRTLSFTQEVGNNAANQLASITANQFDTTVEFNENSFVGTVNLTDNGILNLAGDDKSTLVKLPKGILRVSNTNTLLSGTVLGTVGANGALVGGTVNFAANVPLIIRDTVNLGTITTEATGEGHLAFYGNSIVGQVGAAGIHRLNSIAVNNAAVANSVTEFKSDVFLTAEFMVLNAGTAKIGGNVTANELTSNLAAAANLIFNNTNNVVLTLNENSTNRFATVTVSGKDVSLANNFGIRTAQLIFSNANQEASFTLGAQNLGVSRTLVTSAGNRMHTVVVSGTQTFGVTGLGADGHVVKLKLTTDSAINVNNNLLFASLSTNKTDNSIGIVTFNSDGALAFGLNNFNRVNVIENTTNSGNLIAQTVNVAGGRSLTLNAGEDNKATFTTLNLAGPNSALVVANGFTVTGSVVALTPLDGDVIFLGGGSVSGVLGTVASPLNSVNFTGVAGTKMSLDANAFAANINVGAGTLTLSNNHSFSSHTTTLRGSTLDLASYTLINNGDLVASGVITLGTKVIGTTNGKVEVSTVDLYDVTAAVINIDLTGQDFSVIDGNTYVVLNANTANMVLPRNGAVAVKVTADNDWISNTSFINTRQIGFTVKSDLAQAEKDFDAQDVKVFGDQDLKQQVLDVTNALATATKGSEATRYLSGLSSKKISTPERIKAVKQIVAVAQSHVSVTNVQASNTDQFTTLIRNRLELASGSATTASAGGVAAGDNTSLINGVWVLPFINQATQTSRSAGEAGYKANSYGAAVGFDTKPTDSFTIGLAGTYAKTDMKFKNDKAGDKTTLDTWMFSVYGMQEFAQNWFVQGTASFGSSKVKATENRRIATAFEISTSKYDTMSYNGEVLAGYDVNMTETSFFTPMVGLRYGRFNAAGYKQTGLSLANLSVSSKSTDKFEGILGAKVSMDKFDMSGVEATPELHGFVNYDFANKNPKVDVRIDGVGNALALKPKKAERASFTLGGSLNAKTAVLEYGVGYDAQLSKKYVAHQGTLKIKVNL